MRFVKIVLICAALAFGGAKSQAAGRAAHVVVMVWDGMRADFVSPEITPHLCALASNGVSFLHHHPVYPSLTEANATAISTGVYPRQSSLLANHEFRPAFDPFHDIDTDAIATGRKGDELTGGHYLAFPTLAETLQAHGLRTAVAGTKQVAFLHDRAERGPDALGVNIFAGQVLPESMGRDLRALGKFPSLWPSKINQDQWTTRALTTVLWGKEVPPFSLLWMAEPDYSQHHYTPGSKDALAAIRSSDRNLGRVIAILDKKHLRDSTDIIVVSDHGFSTIRSNIDVPAILQAHGFDARTTFPETGAKDGEIMVVGNGGTFFCYVIGHDPALMARLAHFLQTQPFAGVLFSKEKIAGTFPLADAGLDTVYAPDIVVAMRWTPEQNKYGAPEFVFDYGGGLKAGQGQHATLGPTDMHNICFAAGPDFARDMKDSLPSGNIDIAPTVLWILGVKPPKKFAGRVLSEALTIDAPGIHSYAPKHEAAEWKGDGVTWRQYLDTSTINGEVYLDEGDGAQSVP